MPIDQLFALAGRIVTMDPDRRVIDDGRIYIRDGFIAAVCGPGDAEPAGFESVPPIDVDGTIYPGLIELHNHLPYNAMPLWQVSRRYEHNGQWRSVPPYKKRVSKPSAVLGMTNGVVESLVRYVECRAMLGGATTSQGITLSAVGRMPTYFKGLVRNVETSVQFRPPGGAKSTLRGVRTNVENPPTSAKKLAAYHKKLLDKGGSNKPAQCLLHHISEGTGETALGWFLDLQKEDKTWAINHNLVGIHLTALQDEQFEVFARHQGSMVWSPLSNYLLYGDTARLPEVKKHGIRVALGSDWGPSGSKNLLGELKVAWLASRVKGRDEPVFSPRELVEMVTINPATMIRWDSGLGSLEAGKLADLIVVNGIDRDPYEHLIHAHETQLALVCIGGIPRAGSAELMDEFTLDPVETFSVGGKSHRLYLKPVERGAYDLGVGLNQATEVLHRAMQDLPRLAWEIDSMDPDQLHGGLLGSDGARYRVVPDFEEEDMALDREAFEHAGFEFDQGFGSWVEPMTLPPITEVDDDDFVRTLLWSYNLPTDIKAGLPAIHGRDLEVPDEKRVRAKKIEELPASVRATNESLSRFLRSFGVLTIEDRRSIVDQALHLLEGHYVHLPFKRAMHAVAPLQRLRLLSYELARQTASTMGPEIDFHREMTACFTLLRDLHTGYRLPWPFSTGCGSFGTMQADYGTNRNIGRAEGRGVVEGRVDGGVVA